MGFTSVASEVAPISLPVQETPQIPKPLILDMDFCTDVDDCCALRVAATLHKMGDRKSVV